MAKKELFRARLLVRQNDVHSRPTAGGIIMLAAPDAEVRRIESEEPMLEALREDSGAKLGGVEVYMYFSRNAPMLDFPMSGDTEHGYEIIINRLPKLTKADRAELQLRTAEEVDAAIVAAAAPPPVEEAPGDAGGPTSPRT